MRILRIILRVQDRYYLYNAYADTYPKFRKDGRVAPNRRGLLEDHTQDKISAKLLELLLSIFVPGRKNTVFLSFNTNSFFGRTTFLQLDEAHQAAGHGSCSIAAKETEGSRIDRHPAVDCRNDTSPRGADCSTLHTVNVGGEEFLTIWIRSSSPVMSLAIKNLSYIHKTLKRYSMPDSHPTLFHFQLFHLHSERMR